MIGGDSHLVSPKDEGPLLLVQDRHVCPSTTTSRREGTPPGHRRKTKQGAFPPRYFPRFYIAKNSGAGKLFRMAEPFFAIVMLWQSILVSAFFIHGQTWMVG